MKINETNIPKIKLLLFFNYNFKTYTIVVRTIKYNTIRVYSESIRYYESSALRSDAFSADE